MREATLCFRLLVLLSTFFVTHGLIAIHDTTRYVILGGTGRIGSAVASHLLQRDPSSHVVLVSRRFNNEAAVAEVLGDSQADPSRVSTAYLPTIWESTPEFQTLVDQADCLIHTAGPYLDRTPIPLQMALRSSKCRAYVDVSDPLPYLETSLLKLHDAQQSNLTALVAAGAFPGLSNVLAQEAAQASDRRVQDVRFQYFTAGLGGSGPVNLYITNLGFGEPMVQYDQGSLRFFTALSGRLLGKVDFFLPHLQDAGNLRAKERVGTQTVFAWPFPEAATVATNLKARGNSYAAMGTAPDLWNVMLGVLVSVVPRTWWKNNRFSKFMADFSQPMVWATDKLLEQTGVGETHAMRVDVTFVSTPREKQTGVSIIQAHDSFRRCVGQSCAEFALDILTHPRPGVYVPEQFYEEPKDRSRVIEKLTTTPGTFCYTGPVAMTIAPDPPESWSRAMAKANFEQNAQSQ